MDNAPNKDYLIVKCSFATIAYQPMSHQLQKVRVTTYKVTFDITLKEYVFCHVGYDPARNQLTGEVHSGTKALAAFLLSAIIPFHLFVFLGNCHRRTLLEKGKKRIREK
jgi:hypothetical protein